jgi:1-deoxyxylulose-5-phosphate synthase
MANDSSPTTAGVPGNLEQLALGGSGLSVSQVILGCASIGGWGSPRATWGKYVLDEAQAMEILDTGHAFGITALDTASTYTGGMSEEVVGRWLRDCGRLMVIATKVGASPDGLPPNLAPDHILREFPLSLERLGLASVDVFLSHAPDKTTPIAKTLETFAALLERKKVRAIGACNITAEELREALDESDRLGLPRYECVQNGFSLLEHGDLVEVLPLCRERGLGYTPHSPLCVGILTGKYQVGTEPPPGSRVALLPHVYADFMTKAALDAVEKLKREAEHLEVSAAALALAWVLATEGVTAPIVAPRTPEHFSAVEVALQLQLDPERWSRLLAAFDPGRSVGQKRE